VRLAQRLGRTINAKSDKTLQALKKALPQLADMSAFNAAFDLVSEQRRRANHKARPAAQAFPAFEQFSKDLWIGHAGVRELQGLLEKELDVKGSNMAQRQEAKKLCLISRCSSIVSPSVRPKKTRVSSE
jgi:hypothetical protein